MSIDSASTTAAERLRQLEAMLEAAIANAKQWDFDLPTAGGEARVRAVLAFLAERFESTEPFEVAIGEDGSIEFTASGRASYVTVAIPPDGDRIDAATINVTEKVITWQAEEPALATIAKEIERAAW